MQRTTKIHALWVANLAGIHSEKQQNTFVAAHSLTDQIKAKLKQVLYTLGVARAVTELRLRNSLTVVLLHRVLPPSDERFAAATPEFTLKPETFEAFLRHVSQSHNLVSLQQMEDAVIHGERLPPRSLAVTFDDAWEDTHQYAAPILKSLNIPSILFVPTGVLGNDAAMWRDATALLQRIDGFRKTELAEEAMHSYDHLVTVINGMSRNDRLKLLDEALTKAGARARPMMMTSAQLKELPSEMDLAAHGVMHEPFIELDDVTNELTGSAKDLERITGEAPLSFAFPFGQYAPHHIDAARQAGYRLIFTTDPFVMPLKDQTTQSDVIPRIAISEDDIVDEKGQFCAAKLAFLLAFQPLKLPDSAER